MEPKDFAVIGLAFLVVAVISFIQERGVDVTERILNAKMPIKACLILGAMVVILYFGVYAQGYRSVEFIYRNY